MKYKNVLKALLVSALGGAALLLNAPIASAAPICYISEGGLLVNPSTHACPAPNPNVVYKDPEGQVITNPAGGDRCYTKPAPTSQVPSVTYTAGDCTALEALRTQARRKICEASGGEWKFFDSVSDSQHYSCVCTQSHTTAVGDKCVVQSSEEDPGTPTGGSLAASGSAQKILNLVQGAIDLLTAVAGLAITAMVIVGGIQYSTSGGNPQAAAAAKKRIGNAFLALVVLVFIFTFLQWLIPGGIFQ